MTYPQNDQQEDLHHVISRIGSISFLSIGLILLGYNYFYFKLISEWIDDGYIDNIGLLSLVHGLPLFLALTQIVITGVLAAITWRSYNESSDEKEKKKTMRMIIVLILWGLMLIIYPLLGIQQIDDGFWTGTIFYFPWYLGVCLAYHTNVLVRAVDSCKPSLYLKLAIIIGMLLIPTYIVVQCIDLFQLIDNVMIYKFIFSIPTILIWIITVCYFLFVYYDEIEYNQRT